MSEWKVVNEAEADERHVHLAYITGTLLAGYKLVSKHKGRWRFEDARRLSGRRAFPKQWIGTLWELPLP